MIYAISIFHNSLVESIFLTLFFIFLGFILIKTKILPIESKKVLLTITLKLCIPALAFHAFMQDFSSSDLKSGGWVLLLGVLSYALFYGISFLLFFKNKKRKEYSLMATLGQLTLFSIPFIEHYYDSKTLLQANLLTLLFRIFLYFIAFFMISKESSSHQDIKTSLKKIFLNPIIIAMFIGFIIWITQPIMPIVTIEEASYSFLRIDKTLESIYTPIFLLAKMSTPLAMMLIGMTLTEFPLKNAIQNKTAWKISLLRSILLPLLLFGLLCLLQYIHAIEITKEVFIALVIGMCAPISAVLHTYCVEYDNEAYICAASCLLSTILSIVGIILFVFGIEYVISLGLFL